MEYWLDIERKLKDEIVQYLKTYIMRKKVYLLDYSDGLSVLSLQGSMEIKFDEGSTFQDLQSTVPMVESEEFPGEKETDILCVVDPRNNCQGVRIITPEHSISELPKMRIYNNSENYHLMRMIHGIVEGEEECCSYNIPPSPQVRSI